MPFGCSFGCSPSPGALRRRARTQNGPCEAYIMPVMKRPVVSIHLIENRHYGLSVRVLLWY